MSRVRTTFWLLLASAVVSTGVLTRALTWRATSATGAVVAASGIITVTAVVLAARILVVLGRGR